MNQREAKKQALECIISVMESYINSGLINDSWLDAQGIPITEKDVEKVTKAVESELSQLLVKLQRFNDVSSR